MSDSESDALSSANIPDDKALEKALRDAVAKIYKSGKHEELTIKRVRSAAEKALDLEDGFYKGYEAWKSKSDKIIKEEVEAQEELQEQEDAKPAPVKSKKQPAGKKTTKPAKRVSTDKAQTARKKRKQSTPPADDEELSSALSDIETPSVDDDDRKVPQSPVPTKKAKAVKIPTQTKKPSKQVVDSASGSESAEANKKEEPEEDTNPRQNEHMEEDGSESEMSIVLDEAPPPKRKRKEAAAKTTSTKAKKPAPSKDINLDADQAEIKRLQGWLIKCGIRKMWHRELAPFDTPKAKIRHLKEMLSDAGMQGRYSVEKAKAIREARELKADLEMVQEGAKRWGRKEAKDDDEEAEEEEEEEAEKGRPRRRLARGFKSLDFLDDDGEESD